MAKREFRLRLSGPAQHDIEGIMEWSIQEFGQVAAARYKALLFQALHDIEGDPNRPTAQRRPELPSEIIVYHLRHSKKRARAESGLVRQPRHLIVYSVSGQTIEVLRILHDSRDIERHIP